jgi:hypothetical protein
MGGIHRYNETHPQGCGMWNERVGFATEILR